MYRTWVLLRHTFVEAVVQPIYALLIALAGLTLGVYSILPFFTLGEDVLMYKAVGLDLVLLAALLVSLFAAGRSVYEEIEDRTMLTLMSKPVARWQVILGKFLGLLAAAAVAVTILGLVLAAGVWLRVPGDFGLPANPIDETVAERLAGLRSMHLAGLWPQLMLTWMQVGVLTAVAVLVSTRFSLVVTLPATLLVYVAGNMARFVESAADAAGPVVQALAFALNTVLPYLAVFDATDYTVYGTIALEGTTFAQDPRSVSLGGIWLYVLAAAGYFVAYCGLLLAAAWASLRARELGGAAG